MRPTVEMVVELYQTRDGRVPLQSWLESLGDPRTLARIAKRAALLRQGYLGDHRLLEGSIFELRIFHGPGYRIYGAREGRAFVLLLCGGD